ncbi:putative aldehyde dehydrogenase FUS7 [Fusarium culmorum]|uniref:aldehyde dehydrogenase (NAD(+)) n=1 Tax=Fusarium culmorum TaxID=5516 RepID=A0A2T4H3Z3_FUSCU|nr:putative aldehyde dehydrogenase FUS7 [Fusarium culmorum]
MAATEPSSPVAASPAPEEPSPPGAAPSKKGARFWLIFVAIALTTFLAALDTSIISTALPTIAADLGSDSLYVWIIDSYLLASTATIPIFAQAANIYGRRSLTLTAVCIFTLGSGLCGGAHNTAMMVGGRAVQGIGGGGVLTMSEIVVCDMVSIRERGMYAGIIGGVWAIAAVVAPVMGGAFAQNISWRWIFYINLPIAGVALIALGLFLKLTRPPSGTFKEQMARIDWGGSVLLIGSVTSIVLALSWGGSEHAWSDWETVVPLVIGLVALLAFFAYQVYFQAVKEASPTRSAVMLFPIACTSAPGGVAAGITITKTGKYRIWHFAGFVLMSIACGLFTLLDESSSTGRWVGFQILFGFGTGVVFTSTLPPILASLPDSDVATATGAWTFIRNFGSIWGVAIPAAVFNNHVNHAASDISDQGVRSLLVNGGALITANLFNAMNFTTFSNIIAGSPRGSDTTTSGINPLNQAPLWPASVATANDVEDAVHAAKEAFPSWSQTSRKQRTELLERFADLYLSHASDFCQLLATECGRSAEKAAIEVYFAAQWLRYPAKYELPEERIEDDEKTVIVTHEPLGVVAAICPWNFPLMLAIGKIAPALATGNCVILKPSPFTPYSSLKLVELAQQVFPPSVLQVLHGDNDLGPRLVKHSDIQKISFTGSTATGKQILKDGADTMKRITLETAGNNASIVLPDVDLKTIIPQIAGGLWFNAGQVCAATRRLYIHQDIFDGAVAQLQEVTAEAAKDLVSGVGPIQNQAHYEKLEQALADARQAGCSLISPGRTEPEEGFFIQPTIVVSPPPEAGIVQQENFGPIVSCIKFSSINEAVSMANSSNSGLAASVWSGDISTARRVASSLEAGNVYINGPPRPDPHVPFGGHKQSGLGVEYGLQGLLSYCQTKSTYLYK